MFSICSAMSTPEPASAHNPRSGAPPPPAKMGDGKHATSSSTEETPHQHGHRQRLRQRFLDAGDAALSDYELLELILFRAIPIRDLKPLAKALLAEFGSFAEVISERIERLKRVKGLGEA